MNRERYPAASFVSEEAEKIPVVYTSFFYFFSCWFWSLLLQEKRSS
jgi:hypothetical protein